MPVPSNQIKVTFIHLLLFHPSTCYICDFFPFHIEIEGKCGWIIGGGKGYVGPPLKLLGGLPPPPPPPPPPLPTPMTSSQRRFCYVHFEQGQTQAPWVDDHARFIPAFTTA